MSSLMYTINAPDDYHPSRCITSGLVLIIANLVASPILPDCSANSSGTSHAFLLSLPSPTPQPLLTTPGASSRLLGLSSTPSNIRNSGMSSAAGPISLHGFGTIPAITPLFAPFTPVTSRPHQYCPYSPLITSGSSEPFLHRVYPREATLTLSGL